MIETARGAPDILRRIVARRRERLGGCEPIEGTGWEGEEPAETSEFVDALAARRGRAVIAEVKMGSPRLGSLVGRVDPLRQARIYREHGAAALSVVVEPDFFHGSYQLLAACRRASGLPTLAKDFVVDRRQLVWARDVGAGAVLLVAALYDREGLHRWAVEASKLGLTPLVELHDERDLDKITGFPWALVGVNNRDLRTFEVDLAHSEALASLLPEGPLRVAESGIESQREVARLREAGFDAFLVGESLLLAADPGARLEELTA